MLELPRSLSTLVLRKLRRNLNSLLICSFLAVAFHILSPPLQNRFIAVGQSLEFPHQWKDNKVDPFYNLVLVGNENSPGQNGSAVMHQGRYIELSKQRFEEYQFDVLASEKIPLDRKLKDLRHRDCLNIKYDEDLPSVSVIIIFYNEHPSLILRTVVSVLNRSPHKYLKEVILVDDNSDLPSLRSKFRKAIEYLFPPIVKLIRNRERLGLIKSRMVGSDKAESDVILFLDAHCEVLPGWLEPLLQRIKEDYRNIAMPSHDRIVEWGLPLEASVIVRSHGTFNWDLMHKWKLIPTTQKKLLKTKADPIKSPVSPGGLFAISKRWWEELGRYDPGFEVWGGENLEMSFKTWMCGGKLEILPCSHVAHVFRKSHAYKSHVENSLAINQKRLAEVWMDDYKDIVYFKLPHLKDLDAGDVTKRKMLREQLNCESFDWYMKNILPDKHVPTLAMKAKNGLISSNNQCVDTMQQEFGPVKMYPYCHFTNSQNFQLTEFDQIRAGVELCVEARVKDLSVSLVSCANKNSQKWKHDGPNQPIQTLLDQRYCLSYNNDDVILVDCEVADKKQLWSFKEYINR